MAKKYSAPEKKWADDLSFNLWDHVQDRVDLPEGQKEKAKALLDKFALDMVDLMNAE